MESGMESGTTDAGSTTARAHELRASLLARRDVEAMLTEASVTRQAAAADAEAIVEEAQQVSEQLLTESRTEAELTSGRARERAESILARARSDAEDITRQARAAADAVRARAEGEVEEHRRRVRAELTEQVTHELSEQSRHELARVRHQSHAMIGDLEASVRILGVSLEAAAANVGEMLAALDELRLHTAESLSELESGPDAYDARIDPPPAVADVSDDVPELDDRPLTATEAFLRSSHIDHGDPPLPPMDDAEVGARYARDAARTRRHNRPDERLLGLDAETLDVVPDPDWTRGRDDDPVASDREDAAPEAAGRPLGWLFRS